LKYFTAKEVNCKCGCGKGITTQLAILLDQIREEYGKPITIISGARCKDHNRKVGGARKSAHVQGKAADLVRTPELAKWMVNNLVRLNLRMESLDSTPSWIHIDLNYSGKGFRIFKP